MSKTLALVAALLLVTHAAAAQTGSVEVSDAWARATPGKADIGGVYLSLQSPVPDRLTGRGENYVLKVRGDSMIDDGILDGDYVIIARRERADNGEMVVANVNGEVTLKRLYKEGERVRLQPANSLMNPIYADARDVAVQGVVVGLMRRF